MIYDNLRGQILTSSASPYIVGQHISLTAESRTGRILTNVNWKIQGSQIVSSYPFLMPAPGNTAPATMTYVPASISPQATSIAFYPVFSGNLSIEADATSSPGPVTTTINLPILGPNIQATAGVENAWSVDTKFAYASPQPNTASFIHLGGAKPTASAQGFTTQFQISNTGATIPGNYAVAQLIAECDSEDDLTQNETNYIGTQGPMGVLDTLDGHIAVGSIPESSQPGFVLTFADSPGFRLANPYPVTDQDAATARYMFQTIAMYQFGTDSDSTMPNIWVPLPASEKWEWGGFASFNVQDSTQTWEQSGPAPTIASAASASVLSEPVWNYDFAFYGDEYKEKVNSCQF